MYGVGHFSLWAIWEHFIQNFKQSNLSIFELFGKLYESCWSYFLNVFVLCLSTNLSPSLLADRYRPKPLAQEAG